MKSPFTRTARIRRVRGEGSDEGEDALAVEEPLEIRVAEGGGRETTLAVTMRTPGHDFELAAGFLFSEGILRSPDDLQRIEYATPRSAEEQGNVVRAVLRRGLAADLTRAVRATYTSSACGVCGKTSLEAIWARKPGPLPADTPQVPRTVLAAMPPALAKAQAVFEETGGLHAAAIFRKDGTITTLREDVGRHNAVDKVVGERFLAAGTSLEDHALLVSGRASFEIVQKAVVAGIPFVAAIGAPSSLAVDVAREFGMTLVGFLRGDAFNVYAGSHRIA